eukprot:6263898-Ditylum_brightwellii.AAC.1
MCIPSVPCVHKDCSYVLDEISGPPIIFKTLLVWKGCTIKLLSMTPPERDSAFQKLSQSISACSSSAEQSALPVSSLGILSSAVNSAGIVMLTVEQVLPHFICITAYWAICHVIFIK